MIRFILFLSLAAIAVPAAAVPPPPPVSPDSRGISVWEPGPVLCDGQAVKPISVRRPDPAMTWGVDRDQGPPIAIRFRIDAQGRPLTIDDSAANGGNYAQDIAPALAASRFPAGAARQGCTVFYSRRVTRFADTPVDNLIAYSIFPDNGPLPEAGWRAIRQPGSDCLTNPQPQALVRVSPDFAKLPGTPGVRDWTMIAFDLDKRGRPVAARTLYGTGNTALDAAGVKAVRASRFTASARTGCRFPYYRHPVKLVAPEGPDPESLRPAGSTCPDHGEWARRPVLTYPDPYRRREIEGWAIIAYDVAPWGETGNIRTLAAEPAAAFGRQAEQVIRSAAKPASASGYTGCIDRVRFVLDAGKAGATAEQQD